MVGGIWWFCWWLVVGCVTGFCWWVGVIAAGGVVMLACSLLTSVWWFLEGGLGWY